MHLCYFPYLVLISLITQSLQMPSDVHPTEDYPHYAMLSGEKEYCLFWKFDKEIIYFEVHAKTLGWVGLGISPNGGMIHADIAVGWVKDGDAHLTDHHGVDKNAFPPKDVTYNLKLLRGFEEDGKTVIKFARNLAACNDTTDLPITKDTLRVIWAVGSTDPTGDDIVAANYHGNGKGNRGTKSLVLLEPSGKSSIKTGQTLLHFDVVNNKFKVPDSDTYYNCRMFEIPKLSKKHHIVQVEPVIQVENEAHVHHIIVYLCNYSSLQDRSPLSKDVACYLPNMASYEDCLYPLHAWAVGGGTFYYPSHVGYPIGISDSPKFVVIETHYDNPMEKSDIIDSSGIRFYYTPDVRQYDAAVMQVGVTVLPSTYYIPANAKAFPTVGECPSICLKETMKIAGVEEIKVFGTILHSHLVGVELELRHFDSGGKELAPIAYDKAYDFNYQEVRFAPEEIVIKKEDTLQMFCNYVTANIRRNFTLMGLGTYEEMCLGFIFYYPRIGMEVCETLPVTARILQHLNQTTLAIAGAMKPVPVIKSVQDMLRLLETNWNDQGIADFAGFLATAERYLRCEGTAPIPVPYFTTASAFVAKGSRYVAEPKVCTDRLQSLTDDAGIPRFSFALVSAVIMCTLCLALLSP